MKALGSRDDIYQIANAFRQSRVLLTAVELDFFSALEAGARNAEDVAARCGSDPRATDRLMNVLVGMGLLEKEGDRFQNASLAAEFLVRDKGEYLGNLDHVNHLWDFWSGLTAAVRNGSAGATERVGERVDDWLESFIAAMHHRGLAQAPPDVNLLDLHDAAHVLDVGGGSGVYAMAMLRVKQDLRATVFDLPDVVPLTRRYIEDAGLEDRMDTRAGDYHTDDLGSGYDLVFLSAIVHSNSPEENHSLLQKCAAALNPGGQVVVQDFIMEEDRVRPEHGALFALNMLVATAAGDTYTAAEVETWMREAGLDDITVRDAPSGTTQILGRKRGT
ncbi:MAG: methyltransferase [Bacteroidota bacterium]|nr:methyltransferase [Bacteroidota bacterium]